MTRKDYVAIAGAIRTVTDELDTSLSEAVSNEDPHFWEINKSFRTVQHIARRIANVMEADNPRFDSERFMTACGF